MAAGLGVARGTFLRYPGLGVARGTFLRYPGLGVAHSTNTMRGARAKVLRLEPGLEVAAEHGMSLKGTLSQPICDASSSSSRTSRSR